MSSNRLRLDTEAIVIGYAMSRLDRDYLASRGFTAWGQAFSEATNALLNPPNTFKNLREEFDPIHSNTSRGWHKRSLRQDRQRVLDELKDVTDDALMELVDRILTRDEAAIVEAIDSLAVATKVAHNVAERLLTGRRAEQYFLQESLPLIQVPFQNILDCRQLACGFDFGVHGRPEWAIEVKGMKQPKGEILFTDREWLEAKIRQDNYWVVIVGNLIAEPVVRVIKDPHSQLTARSTYRQTIAVEWHSTVHIES